MIDCAIIGDSVAAIVAQQYFNCTIEAKVGWSSTTIARITGNAELTIISAGSDDPLNKKLIADLRTIRAKRTGKVIWIVPIHPVAAASVRLVADENKDWLVTFTADKNGIHPKSYQVLAYTIKQLMQVKRKRYIDKRLDWRDPNMPIIRKVLIDGKEEVREINPKLIEQYYNNKINNNARYWAEGHWSSDPTYNLRKKK